MIQLDTIMDGIISQYNIWRKSGYNLRDKPMIITDEETIDRNSPVWIITGDLNFSPQSEEYRYIIRQNFSDLLEENSKKFTKSKGLGEQPTLTLDYVFAGPLFESIDPKLLSLSSANNDITTDDLVCVSDHFPIFVSLPLDTL